MSRRKARETAFKTVFQVDQVQDDIKKAFQFAAEEIDLPIKDKAFAWQLASGCMENLATIDAKIAHYSTAWDIERMSSVDRNILRIGAYEILFADEARPPAIPIDEAIEMAKKYSEDNSASFVNAILDKIKGEAE